MQDYMANHVLSHKNRNLFVGKSNDQTKVRVGRIQSMKEKYKTESDAFSKSRDNLKQAKEQLRKLKEVLFLSRLYSISPSVTKIS